MGEAMVTEKARARGVNQDRWGWEKQKVGGGKCKKIMMENSKDNDGKCKR